MQQFLVHPMIVGHPFITLSKEQWKRNHNNGHSHSCIFECGVVVLLRHRGDRSGRGVSVACAFALHIKVRVERPSYSRSLNTLSRKSNAKVFFVQTFFSATKYHPKLLKHTETNTIRGMPRLHHKLRTAMPRQCCLQLSIGILETQLSYQSWQI